MQEMKALPKSLPIRRLTPHKKAQVKTHWPTEPIGIEVSLYACTGGEGGVFVSNISRDTGCADGIFVVFLNSTVK
jgi:hypothetical protein